MEIIYNSPIIFCLIAYENTLSWNELYNLLKNCTEIINALPYEYYHITDILLNDLMVSFF